MKRSRQEIEDREAKYFPDPIAVIRPPKKSTVILLDKSTGTYWNEAAK